MKTILILAVILLTGCASYTFEKQDANGSSASLKVLSFRKIENISVYYNREAGEFRAIAGSMDSAISAETAAKLIEAGAKVLLPNPSL